MKTLIFLDYFSPAFKAGGPIRIFESLARAAHPGQLWIVTQNRDWGSTDPLVGVCGDQWQAFANAQVFYANTAGPETIKRLVQEAQPEVVHLNSFFSRVWTQPYLLQRRMGRLAPARVIISPHGEFAASALANKRLRKTALRQFAQWAGLYRDLSWIATSPKESLEIQKLFGAGATVQMTRPPLPPIYPHCEIEKQAGKLRLIFFARISAMKNLEYLLAILPRIKGEIDFDIYGPIDADYQETWERFQAELGKMPINMTYHGPAASHQAAELLAGAELFVQPSLSENFGYSIVEALASGTPVLISDQTPWNEVNERRIGAALPLNQPEAWVSYLQECVDMNHAAWREHSVRAQAWLAAQPETASMLLKFYQD